MLGNEIKKGIRSPMAWLGLLIALGVYGISFTQNDWMNMIRFGNGTVVDKHNYFLMEFNPYKMILPFAAVLPYAVSVAEDWEHHACYMVVRRCFLRAYRFGKFFAAGILGGGVLTVALWAFLLFLRHYLPLYNESSYYEPFIEPVLKKTDLDCICFILGVFNFCWVF